MMYKLYNVLLVTMVAFSFCAEQEEVPSTTTYPNSIERLGQDCYSVLKDVTTFPGYQPLLTIPEEHGISLKAAELVWQTCKWQAAFVGATGGYILYKLQKAAVLPAAFFGALVATRMAIDRYLLNK